MKKYILICINFVLNYNCLKVSIQFFFLLIKFSLNFKLRKMKSQKSNLWRARVICVVTITKECNTQGAPTHSLS